MRFVVSVCGLGLAVLFSKGAEGHSISQTIGGYQDNGGRSRERISVDASVQGKGNGENLTGTNYDLNLVRDHFQDDTFGTKESQYQQQVYRSSQRINQSAALTAAQTWNRLTDTRVLASFASDQQVRSRSFGAGLSQWFAHETFRFGMDVSRTVVNQPLYQVLDYDSQEIGNPTVTSSQGVTVSLRHLATPTTLVDYTATHIDHDNRPGENSGSFAVRQFVPPLDGAVHATVTRADNRGYVTTESTYGQVDAWIYDGSYLQNLWTGGRARVGYRYYKEDEVTRAYQDQLRLGSDTVTVALSQDVPKTAVDSLRVPLALDMAYSRYANNAGIQAKVFEAGVSAKF